MQDSKKNIFELRITFGIKEVFLERSGRKIWMEKSARLRNLLSLVIFSEGQKFSATFRRKIFEFECGRSINIFLYFCKDCIKILPQLRM